MARRNRSSYFLYLLLLAGLVTYTVKWYGDREQKEVPPAEATAVRRIRSLEIPQALTGEKVIQHTGYALSFNPQHKLASWVAYLQTAKRTANANEMRTDNFDPDPQLTTPSATDADYRNSGYDRGHLAPAEDMAWSRSTMKESFFYSNVAPQVPNFNRGVWRRLEELVRFWSQAYDSIYIVTGPIFSSPSTTIGRNRITVPQQFYKVVVQYSSKGTKGIGFIMNNEPSAATLQHFAVSIDSVEKRTGINFFPRMPDKVEEKVESSLQINDWLWRRTGN